MTDDATLEILRDIFETERAFFGIVRFLEGNTRNNVVAAHMRNTGMALQILRVITDRPPATATMNIDLTGNMLRFLDPVPVVPTRNQVAAGTERDINVTGINCAICQEGVTVATRIRTCGHCFHADCIERWFSMNPRCPVCRHDVREPLTGGNRNTTNENRRMHSDEQ